MRPRPQLLKAVSGECEDGGRPAAAVIESLTSMSMFVLASELLSFSTPSSASGDDRCSTSTSQLPLPADRIAMNGDGTIAPRKTFSAQGRDGLSTVEALQSLDYLLLPLEKSEILGYRHVWYVSGLKNKTPQNPSYANKGYDNDKGNYCIEKGDHIAFQYEMCSLLGKGSFGQVYQCIDHKTCDYVAVKIVKNKRFFNKQAQSEINILHKINQDDCAKLHNCVPLLDSLKFRGHTCLVFPMYSCNLYQFMKNKGFSGSPAPFVLSVTSQLLSALSHLYQLGIVHLDVKPENIMLSNVEDSRVTLIDFGSSCNVDEVSLTYVQSRFYRSPEVLLGLSYGTAADMWSLACVCVELYTGRPLFEAEDELHLFSLQSELLGPAPSFMILSSPNRDRFVDETLQPILKVREKRGLRRRSLETVFEGAPDGFADLFEQMLLWVAEERLLPHEALQRLQLITP